MVDVFDRASRADYGGLPWPSVPSPWHLFPEFFPRERPAGPSLEVAEEGDDAVVRVELPGVKPEDVNVWITDDTVTVQGERRAERHVEQQGYFRTERQYGGFRRVATLPVAVDSDRAQARFEHGVLEIRAPKRNPQEERYGRRLPIQ